MQSPKEGHMSHMSELDIKLRALTATERELLWHSGWMSVNEVRAANASQIERRFLSIGLAPIKVERADDKQPARISGYASVFYDGTPNTEYSPWEDMTERIMPGAFDRAVREDDVRALFNHDPNQILGRTAAGTASLSVDKFGLAYSATPPDTQTAREVMEHLRVGNITGSSFSFNVLDGGWIKENGKDIYQVRAVELYDVGPVTFPAYTATTAQARDWHAAARERFDQHAAEQLRIALSNYRRRAEMIERGL
jgi:HK97 family phage prohead protease